jgi:hypothetical protein
VARASPTPRGAVIQRASALQSLGIGPQPAGEADDGTRSLRSRPGSGLARPGAAQYEGRAGNDGPGASTARWSARRGARRPSAKPSDGANLPRVEAEDAQTRGRPARSRVYSRRRRK